MGEQGFPWRSLPERKQYMWYVIQTVTGKEKLIKDTLQNIFRRDLYGQIDFRLIFYELKRKYRGEWHSEKKLMFPGYVFAVTDSYEELKEKLKEVPYFTKMIGTGKEIVPISREEELTLKRLSGDTETVPMSTGIIEGDRVIITEGNLKGLESSIRKIDRHKRKAWIEIDILGETRLVEAGLEIVRKI